MLFGIRYQVISVLIAISSVGIGAPKENPPREAIVATKEFQEALNLNDVNLMAKFIQFPIKSNEFGQIKTLIQFKSMLPKIFPETRKKGMQHQLPIRTPDGNYSISSADANDPIRFLFKRVRNEYKLYCIDNVNE